MYKIALPFEHIATAVVWRPHAAKKLASVLLLLAIFTIFYVNSEVGSGWQWLRRRDKYSSLGKVFNARLNNMPIKDMLGNGKFNSCAVVGESTSLYTGPRLYAEEIDSHDAVIRLPVAEGLAWYRDRHAAFKGDKTTLEVHYSGNKSWEGVPGVHQLCGAHENVALVLVRTDEGMQFIPEAIRECESGIAKKSVYIEPPVSMLLHALHDELNAAVAWPRSKLLFTEEWLATYMAMAMCNTVDLYGVVTETQMYVYGDEDKDMAEDLPQPAHPKHWVKALQALGMRDIAYDTLMSSVASDEAHMPVPEDYALALQQRYKLARATFRNRLRHLGQYNAYSGGSCMVVGAAPTLKGRGLGDWIDRHDYVWRCNQHVPNRTDVAKLRDHGGRTSVAVSLSVNLVNENVARVLKQAYDDQGTTVMLYPPPWPGDPNVTALYGMERGKEYNYVSRPLYEAVYDWITRLAPTTQFKDGWFFHSTGHFAVNMALFMCDSVSVTGFGLGRLSLFHHGFVLEAMLLELYAEAGLITLEMPEEIRQELRAYMHNMLKSGVLRQLKTKNRAGNRHHEPKQTPTSRSRV